MAVPVLAVSAQAHPHVFIDGGVDFVVGDGGTLEALQVTWLYDEFETLYILSVYEMSLNARGGLDEVDRLELVRRRSEWPIDFDGSAHLSVNGQSIPLAWPSDLDAQLRDGRLEVTFTRTLEAPLDLRFVQAEVAFYESTYFFDFTVTDGPEVLGEASGCVTELIPFVPDAEDTALQEVLAKLGREEMPDNGQVGALFADRITVQCA